jgi:preprotein translocase SecF subunit
MPVFDIVGKRRWYYAISALITIPGLIIALMGPFTGGQVGLQFSIDYTGGTVWEIHFRDSNPTPAEVREVLTEQGLGGNVALTTSGERQYVLIRTEPIGLIDFPSQAPSPSPAASPDASPSPGVSPGPGESPAPSPAASPSPSPSPEPVPPVDIPTDGPLAELAAALQARFGPIDEVRQQATIGPLISAELAQQALVLILLGSAGILGWMTFRFSDYRMGAAAIVALVHDVLVVVGLFAILGTVMGVQIDALFVTAMLTVIGFSVHDTIVVFDRIRENRIRHAGEPFAAIVNHSLLQTLGRSLNTSLTTILVLAALMLFGSEATRAFIFAMVAGILTGVYSSIFNASSVLVDWHEWSERRRQRQFSESRA